MRHESVLLKESVEELALEAGDMAVDATLGFGGHSLEILKEIGENGKLIGFDCDELHLAEARERLKDYEGSTIFIRKNFVHLKSELKERGIESVDGVLFDLGIASPHVDVAERGFSFNAEGPLDMRLNQELELTAYEVVNKWSQEELARIFKEYGEEKDAKKLAGVVVKRREESAIETTKELADLILKHSFKRNRTHPATKIFQAIRIAVNDELGVLESALGQALEVVAPGGRVVVISYHSLEDRIVKNKFKECSKPKTEETIYSMNEVVEPAQFRLITKKPIVPGAEEIARNPRSRSAKLRVVEKNINS